MKPRPPTDSLSINIMEPLSLGQLSLPDFRYVNAWYRTPSFRPSCIYGLRLWQVEVAGQGAESSRLQPRKSCPPTSMAAETMPSSSVGSRRMLAAWWRSSTPSACSCRTPCSCKMPPFDSGCLAAGTDEPTACQTPCSSTCARSTASTCCCDAR